MTDTPRGFFSNPRKLPTDDRGLVNPDMPSEAAVWFPPDPETGERFLGRMFDEIPSPNGNRLIMLFRWDESDPVLPIETANHNVFRLDAQNQVVWQVRRVENDTRMPWDKLHAFAIEKFTEGRIDSSYTPMGYLDPFTSMNLDERAAIDSEPKGVWRPGCVVYLLTRWWSYVLDPETGIATCTGDQVK